MDNEAPIRITPEQLKGSPKRIGWLKKKPVYHLMTKGGFQMILCKDGQSELLGAANHIGVARHIAKMKHPEIVFDELSKSEDTQLPNFDKNVETWSNITDQMVLKLDESN